MKWIIPFQSSNPIIGGLYYVRCPGNKPSRRLAKSREEKMYCLTHILDTDRGI
jgi:hypothetical protein